MSAEPTPGLVRDALRTRALTLLSVGSFLILISWALAAIGIRGDLLFLNLAMMFAWIGAFVHYTAWGHLAFGLPRRSAAWLAFGLAVIVFSIGILTLPYALPPLGWFASPWFLVLFLGFFFQLPSPVGAGVALHG
ncbi:MAG: hypothetical protein R3291_00895, partial [Thermoplasmata archaeon]|nr:hypothetical protein [Thermoplasmata archaeon]